MNKYIRGPKAPKAPKQKSSRSRKVTGGGVGGTPDIMGMIASLTPKLQMKPVQLKAMPNTPAAQQVPHPYSKLPAPIPAAAKQASAKAAKIVAKVQAGPYTGKNLGDPQAILRNLYNHTNFGGW